MRRSTVVTLIVAAAVAVVIGLVLLFAVVRPFGPSKDEVAQATPVVASDSHRLGERAGDTVTLTEFLDFECEICAGAHPYLERIREDYAGRVDFVVRYFPMPGHKNSMTAASAVEAAARQGYFAQMHDMMFLTQQGWGERQDSQEALFREFAVQLGLDMDRFDEDLADPALTERVRADFEAGRALGVDGTPTFFVNERRLDDVRSFDDVRAAIDAALAAG